MYMYIEIKYTYHSLIYINFIPHTILIISKDEKKRLARQQTVAKLSGI